MDVALYLILKLFLFLNHVTKEKLPLKKEHGLESAGDMDFNPCSPNFPTE